MKNCLIFPLLLISILYFTSCDPNPSGKNAEAGGLSLQASFDSLQVIEKLILTLKSKDHENALILANNGLNLAWQSGSDSLVANFMNLPTGWSFLLLTLPISDMGRKLVISTDQYLLLIRRSSLMQW